MLDVPVRAENECLGGVAGRQLLQALRAEAVQPGQPVRSGDLDDAAVRAVDQAGRADQRPLLAVRIAVMRCDPDVAAVGGNGARGGEQRASHAAKGMRPAPVARYGPMFSRQSAHRPNTVRCPTSVSNPNSLSSAVTRLPTAAGSTWMTFSQSRQTRCTCCASAAGWYTGAPWPRWVCVTRPTCARSS